MAQLPSRRQEGRRASRHQEHPAHHPHRCDRPLVAVAARGRQRPTQSGTSTAAGARRCNQATPSSLGGALVARTATTARHPLPGAPEAPPGGGAGLARAAANSPALSLCSIPGDDGRSRRRRIRPGPDLRRVVGRHATRGTAQSGRKVTCAPVPWVHAADAFSPQRPRLVRRAPSRPDGGAGAGLAGDRHAASTRSSPRRPARARRSPRSSGGSTGSRASRGRTTTARASSTSRR